MRPPKTSKKAAGKPKNKGQSAPAPRQRQRLTAKPFGVQQLRKNSTSYVGQPPMNPQMNAYLNALVAPFDVSAEGARVPEPYAVLTRTTKNISLYTLRPSNANFLVGSTLVGPGYASGVIFPHANFTVATNAAASGGANCSISGGQAVTINGNGATDWRVSGNVGQSVLEANYETYRLVAMGIKFRSNMSFTDASGRMVVAVVPSMNTFPGATQASGSSNTQYAALLNAPWDASTNGISTDIMSLPTAMEYSMTDLLSGSGVEVRVPLTSPLCKQFLVTDSQGGPGFVTNTALGVTSQAHADYYATGGFSNVMFVIEGMKEGTSVTIEIVQHFEGIPKLANQTGTSGILVDQSVKAHTAVPMAAEMAAQAANQRPVQGLAATLLGPVRAYSDKKGGVTKALINGAGEMAKKGAGHLALSLMGLGM